MQGDSELALPSEHKLATVIETDLEFARPWPRYWARTLDILIYSAVLGFAAGVVFPEILQVEIFQGPFGDFLLGFILLPFAMILDAAILTIFGTTLGKKLAGLSVVVESKEQRTMERMMRRNLRCYVQGLALGIPFINLYTYIQNYNLVEAQGSTDWDNKSGSWLVSVPNGGGRTVATAFCVIAIGVALRVLSKL